MKITLNNRKEEFDKEKISIADLIKLKNFTFKMLITKVNGKVINKEKRATTFVKDGDDVIILHLISGG